MNLISVKETLYKYNINLDTFNIRTFKEYYRLDNKYIYGRSRRGRWYALVFYRDDEGSGVANWIEKTWKPLTDYLESARLTAVDE